MLLGKTRAFATLPTEYVFASVKPVLLATVPGKMIFCIGSPFFPKQFTVRGSQFFLKMCPPFLFICLPILSLPALFRWPCSISIRLSPKSVTVSVLSPFCFLFSGLVSLVVGHCVRLVSLPFPFVSLVVPLLVGHCVGLVFLLFPFVSLLVGHCVRLVSLSCLPSVSFCFPSCWSLCPPCLPSCLPLSRVLSPFLLVTVSVLFPFCFLFPQTVYCQGFSFPFLLVIVSALSPFLLVVSVLSPFCFLLSSFLSPFLLMSQKRGLGNASLLSHLFGAYGGVIFCTCRITPGCVKNISAGTNCRTCRQARINRLA